MATALLDHQADIDQAGVLNKGFTPLMLAARQGKVDMLELLLANNASIDVTDKKGFTALSWAAQRGHQVIADFLLLYNADVDIPTKERLTALSLAAGKGHLGVLKALLTFQPDTDIQVRSLSLETPSMMFAKVIW